MSAVATVPISVPLARRATTSGAMVQVDGLTKRFPIRRSWRELARHPFQREFTPALTDVSLSVQPGEFFGLLGPNGAGKTTLFKLLATLVSPDAGTATLGGYDITREPADVRKVLAPVIADERSLNWRISARANLELYAVLLGLRNPIGRQRVDEVLNIVELTFAGERAVGTFSSGMKRRLLIARALLSRPRYCCWMNRPPVSIRSRRSASASSCVTESVEIDYGSLPKVSCFPNQLNQVFMNILVNAAHAIEGKGTITIATQAVDGQQVQIRFSDSGKGIDAEHLEQIFDPGFTTKGVGVGTGLGLAISYNIIQKHEGSIAATSTPGAGTAFTLTLAFAGGDAVEFPLNAPEGGKEPSLTQMEGLDMGSDHDVFFEGTWKIPGLYLHDWPDRYIHTNYDLAANIDPTKLKRAAFVGAVSAWFLANMSDDDVPAVLAMLERNALVRSAELLERRSTPGCRRRGRDGSNSFHSGKAQGAQY